MKLSESTINVLKNFANINAGMQFKEGSVVRTISKGQNVLGKATIKESFEKDFVIYDLNRFLSLCGSLTDPEIVINTDVNNLTIKSGTSKTTYGLADESMIVAPPAKEIKVENAEVGLDFGLRSVLMAHGYNEHYKNPRIPVVPDWKSFYQLVIDHKEPAPFQ